MSSEEKLLSLEIRLIRLDGGTQVREKLDETVVEEYAERMAAGDDFPPIMVIHDGEHYWLADGFHRLHAVKKREQPTIECRVFEGTRRDAILVAVKANSTHGLRRTNADKRRAVAVLLADEEWSAKTNRWIAEVCGVGHQLVETVRRQIRKASPTSGRLDDSSNHPDEGGVEESMRLGQDGRCYAVRRATQPHAAVAPADGVDEALEAAESFDACLVRLKKTITAIEKVACAPGGQYLFGARLDDCRTHLREAAHHLTVSRPKARCEQCGGAGCAHCRQHGWVCAAIEGPQWRLS
jgi:hypothetical protein